MHLFFRIGLAAILLALLIPAAPVQAQNSSRLVLQPPDISHFPTVDLTFEAYGSGGSWLNELKQAEIRLSEDGQAVNVVGPVRIEPGMHIILAFNVAQAMAATGSAAPARFDQLKTALLNWMHSQPAGVPDEFSLVTNIGAQVTRVTSPAQWANALQAYVPDLAKAQASLASLTTALDLAGDPTRRAQSKRAVLYITAPLPDSALTALPNLADRAGQLGVRVTTWLVQPTAGASASSKALADLAARTGGSFFSFTGSEALPDLEAIFQPQRYLYRVTYTSAARQAGAHSIRLAVQRGETNLGAEQTFSLSLQPPNPFFLALPVRIQRSWTKPEVPDKPVLTPTNLELRLMVEFPDGLRRGLRSARLLVDGKEVSAATVEPFDRLTWPLDGLTASGRHTLRVVVEDIFGLSRESTEMPVDVEVEPAPLPNLAVLATEVKPYLPYAGFGLAGLAGLFFIGSWLLRNRARFAPPAVPRASRVRQAVSPPVVAIPSPFSDFNAPACLERLAEGDAQRGPERIALSQELITLGSDPRQAAWVIASASVDGLHASILRDAAGSYLIRDEGSLAGTWVNYAPAPPQGVTLAHGDRVQLGYDIFRFLLKDPPPARQPRVTPYREEA